MFRSRPSTMTWFGLVTLPYLPGLERHPSSPVCVPSDSTMTGLISTLGSSPVSTTMMRFRTPTCGAASPTPLYSYIVSNMSSISSSIFGVISFTSLHFFSRTLSPTVRTVRIAISYSFSYTLISNSIRISSNPLFMRIYSSIICLARIRFSISLCRR